MAHGDEATTLTSERIALVREMLPAANAVRREPCSAAHITIGLQCGGSDGYSGISANPALGAAVDLLVAHGGTAILSETPEIYGAEHLLTRRAVRQIERVVGSRTAFAAHHDPVPDFFTGHFARFGQPAPAGVAIGAGFEDFER